MLEQFRKDLMTMRKEKNPLVPTMVTVFSEASMIAKDDGNREITESDLIRQIKKTVTNLNVTIDLLVERNSDATHQINERELLESYLPKQLSDDEVRSIVNQFLTEQPTVTPKIMGSVMQFMKSKYDGLYDGKKAASLVKECINNF